MVKIPGKRVLCFVSKQDSLLSSCFEFQFHLPKHGSFLAETFNIMFSELRDLCLIGD